MLAIRFIPDRHYQHASLARHPAGFELGPSLVGEPVPYAEGKFRDPKPGGFRIRLTGFAFTT
jgi:hypothetical protein